MFPNAPGSRRNGLKVTHLVWCSILLVLVGNVGSLPLDQFYPFDLIGDIETAKSDDGGSHRIHLATPFPFFNSSYSYLYVNNNGIISFDEELNTYKPLNFNETDFEKTTPPLIAPYWADVDIENVNGENESIVYRLTNESSILKKVNTDVRNNFIGLRNFSAKLVLIVTWYNVGFYGAQNLGKKKRNTFQGVVATSGTESFAIFNYNETVWTTGTNSDGVSDTGLGGKPAVVGFYSGSDGRYYLLDYSGSDEIININRRTNVGIPGKYMFRLDGDINDLSCSAKEVLSIYPSSVSMLGREIINVAGPCLTGFTSVKGRIRELNMEFNCRVIEDSAVCVIPSLFRTGELTFELNPYSEGWNYSAPLASVNLLNVPTKLVRDRIDNWDLGKMVSVSWSNDSVPAGVEKEVSVLAYKMQAGISSLETVSSFTVEPRETSRRFKLASNVNGSSTLVISLCWRDSNHSDMLSRCIWSDVFPVRWKDSHSKESENWCRNWLNSEQTLEPIEISPQNCPCLVSIAENDVGHFSSDPYCDNSTDSKNCVYNINAHKCFRRNNKKPLDSGETCCYDDKGELMDIRYSSGAGTHQRYHHKSQGEGVIPFFSYFESDLLPKLHCCQYSDTYCTDFVKYRNATMCQNYSPPSPAQACGDPHLVTLDGRGYSFNGVGDFYLVTDTNSSVVIQVRAVRAKNDKGALQNATVFTQVAMTMPGLSDIVEIRKLGEGLETLVNKRTIPATTSTTSQFNNITLLHKDDGSYLMVLEPISVSISIEVTPELLNIIVFIGEESLKGELRGLLGNYNGDPEDDFIARNGTVLPDSISMREIHFDFGMTWQVQEADSILSEASVVLESNISFQPVFLDETDKLNLPNDTYEICGENQQCIFDYGVTRDKSIAKSTAQFVSKFEEIRLQLDQKVVRCPYLDKPTNGNITLTGNSEGDTATAICNPGFEATSGDYVRKCLDTSEWSGSEIVCAERIVPEDDDKTYEIIIVGVASSVGTIILVIVVVVLICLKRRQRKQIVNRQDTQEIPLSTINNIPMYENPAFTKLLHDITSEGRFRIPRPYFVDPRIIQEYF